ncbi:MAG: hypothetical protein M3Y28_09990 [Armatimonadota bacterium]|nr:hypothetical protein [Armatimonadota bacterium]
MELLLGQFLVLGFTLIAWWLARRDLSARAAQAQTPALAEWERLREAVETLIADLERRAEAAEGRIAEAEQRLGAVKPNAMPNVVGEALVTSMPAPMFVPMPDTQQMEHDERYAPAYALADSGVTDAGEIARRTGLGQGEVELILGLRARSAH